MAGDNKKKDENFIKNLAILKRRALDVKFDIDTTQYKPLENIGIGAYGVVCSAVHRKANDRVAIKKIPNVFDVKDVAKRTYREIKILKHFTHDNIIHIREILKPKESLSDFRDVYVVFDLMESDLHKIIYSKQELTEEHVRYFLYQILRGLKYIHSAHVIHRDLKPSNLLVNEDCQLRIGDFGMARGFSSSPSEPKHFMTQYVATRFYRAPEIMLSLIEYGAAVDMWSVGCIFAEMLGRKHLFPGKNSVDQIKLIVGCLGTPDNNLLQLCQSPIIKTFFQEMGHKEPVPWSKLYPKASKKAINLLSRMLVLNPKDRVTVDQALVHPFLNKYHDPDDEPICLPTFNFDFEKEDLSVVQLRSAIHKEIMEYHEPRTPTFSFNAELTPVPKSPTVPPSKPDAIPDKEESASLGSVPPPLPTKPEPVQQAVIAVTTPCTALNPQHSVTVTKPSDDDMFKKPFSMKKEPEVKVKTEDLKADVSDVEMLSARSTDERQPMSATVSVTEEKKVEKPALTESQESTKDDKNKTISEGTKNLIKAALMNASFKKRTDSQGDDDRPKPVTAAMRQKEREDKRKKKKEKNLERKRKEKKKNPKVEELLTSEDKELLQRWTKMQKVNVPIAPKPRSESLGQGQENAVTDASGSGSMNRLRKDSIGQVDQCSGQGQPSFHSNQMNVQQETLDLLQQRILGNSVGIKQEEVGGEKSQQPVVSKSSPPSVMGRVGHTSHSGQQATNAPALNITAPSSDAPGMGMNVTHNGSKDMNKESGNGNFSVDFSEVPLGDLDFLSMVTSPDITKILSQNITEELQRASVNTSRADFRPAEELQYSNVGQIGTGPSFQDENSRDFLQKLCSQSIPVSVVSRRTSDNFAPQDHVQDNSANHLNVSPSYQNRLSPNLYQQGHSPASQQSVSPNQRISPHFFDQGGDQTSVNTSQHMGAQVQPQIFTFSNQSDVLPGVGNQSNVLPNVDQHQSNVASHLPFQGMNVNLSDRNPDPSTLFMSSREPQNQSVADQQRDFNYRNQSTIVQEVKDSHNSSSNSNSPPPLSVNTRQTQLSFHNIFQNPVPGPSHAGNNQLDDTQLDLVALLTKQLSKSNVDDFCPPLALTPRGTGAGYGLGVDLDALMNTGDADGPVPEPSPLSSSILADWMEVTGNMNIDMEALEQELQSPMALSYNDLNMYPS